MEEKTPEPRVVAIDFETFYTTGVDAYSLSKMDYRSYAKDPRFCAEVISYYDGERVIVCHPKDFDWELLRDATVVSFNAAFDYSVYELGLGAPGNYPFKEWVCAMASANYLGHMGSLADVAYSLFGVRLSKTTRTNMANKHWVLTDEVKEYAASDAIWAYKIWKATGKFWPVSERWLWNWTTERGYQGLPVDTKALDGFLGVLKKKEDEYAEAIPLEKKLSIPMMRKECERLGVPPPETTRKDSEKFQDWVEKYGELCPFMGIIPKYRSARKTRGNVERIQQAVYWDEKYKCFRFPYSMKYFGAHTGRWSGSGGFNMQNMNREAVEGVNIRNTFIAPPGYKLIVLDLSQIEVRVLAYLANAHGLLDEIRGNDIYEIMACRFGTYHKDWADSLKSYDHSQGTHIRHTAKTTTLGCQFGLSAKGFQKANPTFTLEQAEECVMRYRQGLPEVVQYWYSLGNQLERALLTPRRTLELPLPSGRVLFYRDLKKLRPDPAIEGDRGGIACTRKGVTERLWHGSLTNNVVQGTARDIFGTFLKTIEEETGAECLLTVHDEIMMIAKEDGIDEKFSLIHQIMSTPPAWCKEIPLEAEGKIMDKYTK